MLILYQQVTKTLCCFNQEVSRNTEVMGCKRHYDYALPWVFCHHQEHGDKKWRKGEKERWKWGLQESKNTKNTLICCGRSPLYLLPPSGKLQILKLPSRHALPKVGKKLEQVYNKLVGFPSSSVGKESACNTEDRGLIPGLGRSPGEGNGNPLQSSCLENPMDRGAWWSTVPGIPVRHDCATFTSLQNKLKEWEVQTIGCKTTRIYYCSTWGRRHIF